MKMDMTRNRAFLAHFCLSALIVLTVLTVIMLLWYPGPYFRIIGAFDVIKVLIAVDLVLGPLLTLILFKPGKKGLMFDMWMIATIQLTALIYGVNTLYLERPYYTIFVQDRFQILAERDIDKSAINHESLLNKPWNQPIFVAASMPDDPLERSKIVEDIFFAGGKDVHLRPELWLPYADSIESVSKKAKPLIELLERHPDRIDEINSLLQQDPELVYLPVMGRKDIQTMILDGGSLKPVTAINVDPWGQLQADNS